MFELLIRLYQVSLAIGIALLVHLVINEIYRYRARNPLFSGPRGMPIFGNLLDIRMNASEVFRNWSRTYGDVFQIQLGNVPVIVVNSAAAAKELFGYHGHALGSRPTLYTFHKIISKTSGATIGTSPLSQQLKMRRRAATAAMKKPAVASYALHLHVETLAFIQYIFSVSGQGSKPISAVTYITRFALSIILTLKWGTRITSDDADLFQEIREVEAGIARAKRATENDQDYIPLLRLNPWSFASQEGKMYQGRREVYSGKLDGELQERIRAGTHSPCIQANAMLDPEAKLTVEDLRCISMSLIQGGAGTIASTISWAIAYFSRHPEIQAKAFAELSASYPDPSAILTPGAAAVIEQAKFPYLHALAQECLRYFTVLPLSLPRATTEDVTFHGRLIPSGSMIILNAWACNMDLAIWDDPESFRPERWLEQPDAPHFSYGLGYRMCAGNDLANKELQLTLLRSIGCYNIKPVAGREADASPWTGSSNVKEGGSYPKQYEGFFEPRKGLDHAVVIRQLRCRKSLTACSVQCCFVFAPLSRIPSKVHSNIAAGLEPVIVVSMFISSCSFTYSCSSLVEAWNGDSVSSFARLNRSNSSTL